MSNMPPKLKADYYLHVLRFIFGTHNWKIAAVVFLFLLSFSLFTSSIFDMPVNGITISNLLFIISFVVLIIAIVIATRTASGRLNLSISEDVCLQKCKALILFLSPNSQSDNRILQRLKDAGKQGKILDIDTRKMFQGSWRMPFEAMAYHLGPDKVLQKVYVITSSDSPPMEDEAPKKDGTHRMFNEFKEVAELLLAGVATVEIFAIHNLFKDWSKGVDFEGAEAQLKVLERIYDELYQSNLRDYHIMVDITGGKKLAGIAGMAISLKEGRRFQYVSTLDYKVKEYDITYRVT